MEPLKQITESAELIDPLLESLGGATEKARPLEIYSVYRGLFKGPDQSSTA